MSLLSRLSSRRSECLANRCLTALLMCNSVLSGTWSNWWMDGGKGWGSRWIRCVPGRSGKMVDLRPVVPRPGRIRRTQFHPHGRLPLAARTQDHIQQVKLEPFYGCVRKRGGSRARVVCLFSGSCGKVVSLALLSGGRKKKKKVI